MNFSKTLLTGSIVSLSLLFTEILPLTPASALTFRSIDGSGNNLSNPTWGAANTPLLRLTPSTYQDGYNSPRSLASDGIAPLPNPRDISNTVVRQDNRSLPSPLHLSDWLFQWGQFIDHDLDLNEPAKGTPASNIPINPIDIATGLPDPLYSPMGIPFTRNEALAGTGTGIGNPRQQINLLTSYIDGSQVYGSSQAVADQLRTFSGGKLKSQILNGEELLPLKTQANVPAANPLGLPDDRLFAGGDPRPNEQIGLMAVHTLLLREHNRLATELKTRLEGGDSALIQALMDTGLNEDEFLYQSARKGVGAQIQVITYQEFLPLLIGTDGLSPYLGYDPTVNAGISNEFANAAFRFGHTTLSPSLLRTDENHQILQSILLADAFFNTQNVIDRGVDSLLIGLASQKSQAFDPFIVDSVRNFLFPSASGGSDLAAVNIARGREVGIGTLNQVRSALGLIPYSSFADINPDPEIIARLSAIYASVEDIDLWVGGLAEMPVSTNALLGETFRYIIADQFTRLRDGDRFFYLHDLNDLQLLDPNIAETTLSQLITRNSTINTMQANAFYYTSVPEPSSLLALLGLGLLGVVQVILAKGLA